jgi:16S rRNA (cytidine1402-2'-O)-methyltransferase
MNASLIQQAAASAAGTQHYPQGALYVVATPLGNLSDLTWRAVHLLGLVDAVACEDTRVTAGLLRSLGLDKPLLALHEHNEAEAAQRVLERLARGERVACVSDAGTPAVSDPGARLVAAARAAGHRVLPLPGPSSVTAALSVAGDTRAGSFRFAGFLSTRAAERAAQLRELQRPGEAVVLFEAPHRIAALAAALAEVMPGRPVTLCRELTKQFETIATLSASALPPWLDADANRQRGEFVLVLHAPPEASGVAEALPEAAERLLEALLEARPLKQAVALAAEAGVAPRNLLYRRALALRAEAGEGASDAADPPGGQESAG